MQYFDDRYHLHVQFDTRQCQVPPDVVRIQQRLEPLGEAVKDLPEADLALTLIYHPRSDAYHADAKLKLPGETLATVERDAHLDLAIERCIGNLVARVGAYKEHPNQMALP